MQVFVYRSRRKADTYVYLAQREAFDTLPEPLRASLGPLDFALEFTLTAERRLAREDPQAVRRSLASRGFHLQVPPHQSALDPAAGAADDPVDATD